MDEVLTEHAGKTKAPERQAGAFDFKVNPATGEGTASYVFTPKDRDASFDQILAKMVPDVPVEVLEVVEVRAWGDPESPYQYVKTRVRQRTDNEYAQARERLMADVRRRKGRRRTSGDKPAAATLVVAPADLQIGKNFERGGGTPETFARCMDYTGKVQDRWRDLRKAGVALDDMLVLGMGDTTEGIAGHYPNQPYTIDCNESDQVEVATTIHDRWVDAWSALPGLVQLEATVVNSNHDRPRQDGQYTTDSSDSRAFTIWRSLARAYAKNPDRYGHVAWTIPDDPLVGAVERHSHGIAVIHGDQAQKYPGSIPPAKVWNWWDGQMAGGPDVCIAARCDVMVAAHFHHGYALRQQGRTLLGCPSSDGGSQWLTDAKGIWSDPGLLTFVVDATGAHSEMIL